MTAKDEHLVELDRVLSEPLSLVRDRENSAFDKLLAGCGNRLVLFGAGNLGRTVLQCVRSIGVEPLAFADNSQSKWRSYVDGVPVLSPKDAAAMERRLCSWSPYGRWGTFTRTAERSSNV